MKTFAMRCLLAATLLVAASLSCVASPCDAVDRALPDERKAALEPQIARQLNVPHVEVQESFAFDGWNIIYAEVLHMDGAFLFFSGDPLSSRYVELWAGAARKNEQWRIRKWETANLPGIPDKLASCFAWYVTRGQK